MAVTKYQCVPEPVWKRRFGEDEKDAVVSEAVMAEFRDFRGAKSEEAKSKVRKEAATIVVEINKNFSKGIPYVS